MLMKSLLHLYLNQIKSVGTVVKALQAEKQDAKVVANGTLSNNPDGTDVSVNIDSNVFVKVVAFGE